MEWLVAAAFAVFIVAMILVGVEIARSGKK